MRYYLTRRSLDSVIEVIERADKLLGGNIRVTDSHPVFRPVLVPALAGIILGIAAAVCLAVFIHPLAGAAAAILLTYIAVRIRNKRLHLQRIIVYDRVVARKLHISDALEDKLKGDQKKRYETSLGDTDPEVRKAELVKVYDELNDLSRLLVHDINFK